MYARLGGVERQPEQLASQMRSIRGVELAVLFYQLDGSSGRASLRSRGRVDANVVATELGGGGHPSAAGCRFAGDYAANRDRVLDVVRRHVAALRP
jgi:phosphoesterase RecJ-like protein